MVPKATYEELEQKVKELNEKVATYKRQTLTTQNRFVFSKTMLDATPDLFVIKDQNYVYQAINSAFCDFLGKQEKEIIGKTDFDLFPHDEAEKYRKEDIKVIESGQSQIQDEHVTGKDGMKFLQVAKRLVFWGEEAEFGKGVLCSVRDVSDRKQAEDELRLSEERYRTVVDSQAELICRSKSDCTLTFVNDAYCRYFHMNRSDLLGKKFIELIPEEEHERVLRHFSSFSPEQPIHTHEHKVKLPSGEIRWQQWTNRAIFDENGHIVEVQDVGRDITERKQTEEELLKAKNELEFQIEKRTTELARKNIALKEILDQIELEKKQMSERVRANVDKLLLPIIKKLTGKSSHLDKGYLEMLEKNIKNLTASFGINLGSNHFNLTTKEIEICNLIKEGFTGKEIATMHNLSFKTIASHRYNIRKKLGISSKKINLASYLRSL